MRQWDTSSDASPWTTSLIRALTRGIEGSTRTVSNSELSTMRAAEENAKMHKPSQELCAHVAPPGSSKSHLQSQP